MAGIVFIKTKKLDEVKSFYQDQIGMTHWLSQPDVEILRHENLLVGFHQQADSSQDVLLTFFYASKGEVDAIHGKLSSRAIAEPKDNEKYKIYNFFAKDPEGRLIEFQWFNHELPDY